MLLYLTLDIITLKTLTPLGIQGLAAAPSLPQVCIRHKDPWCHALHRHGSSRKTNLTPLSTIGTTSWRAIGPGPLFDPDNFSFFGHYANCSGRVTAIATDPTNANTYYICAAGGGVWKTTDAGTSFTPLTDNLPDLAMGAIAVAPSDANVIYVGTGEANFAGNSRYGVGVLKSTDGGSTWTVLTGPGNAFYRRAISKIVVDPTNSSTVYLTIAGAGLNGLGGNRGVWKSIDGGMNWTNTFATAGLSTASSDTDLVIDPSNPQTLYAAIGSTAGSAVNGVYKTTNGGASWSLAGNFPVGSSNGRISLAIASSLSSTVYASVAGPTTTNASLKALYKSTDSGATWVAQTSTPDYLGGRNGAGSAQGWYDNTIAVSPTNANVVFAAGVIYYNPGVYGNIDGIVGSLDGGATWTDFSVGKNFNAPHTDWHALAFTADGRLLSGSDGGVWRLENPSDQNPVGNNPNSSNIQWTDLNTNLNTIQIVGCALHPTDPAIAFEGAQDNGTSKTTGSIIWNEINGGDGGFCRVDQSSPATVYASYVYGRLYRSDDGGNTFAVKTTGILGADDGGGDSGNGENQDVNANFYAPYILDPVNQSQDLVGNDLCKSVSR